MTVHQFATILLLPFGVIIGGFAFIMLMAAVFVRIDEKLSPIKLVISTVLGWVSIAYTLWAWGVLS